MTDRPTTPLLELDPELGQLLTAERRAAAEHELRVRVTNFPVGEWDGGRLADADPMHLGLLVARRRARARGRRSRHGQHRAARARATSSARGTSRPRRSCSRYDGALERALADAARAARPPARRRLGRYPGGRRGDRRPPRRARAAARGHAGDLAAQPRRPAAAGAVLAPRRALGRGSPPTASRVPLALSHRLLGQLVGARRPTVSTALGELAARRRAARAATTAPGC